MGLRDWLRNTVEPGVMQAHLLPLLRPTPWLDRPDADERIRDRVARGRLTDEQATQCRKWVRDGYVVLDNPFAPGFLDRVWSAYEAAVRSGTVPLEPEKASDDDPHPGRFLNPHERVPELDELLRHPAILDWCRLLIGAEPIPFQTITCHKGSQQPPHSDSIHMTTYPLGYLSAAWIAFEDIHPACGALVYYPGSHRLPYLFSKEVGITAEDFRRRPYAAYAERYEPAIQRAVDDRGIQPVYFMPKKGDVLIWHANLVHGGSRRKDMQRSRRAVVCHYFARGALCYSDLSGTRIT
jgi:hypothetical protein